MKRLEQISGFESLKEILERHFIERGHILRAYRIVGDAQKVLEEIRFTHLRKLRKEIHKEKELLDEFLGFIHRPGGDPDIAKKLEDLVREKLDVGRRVSELESLHAELEDELETLSHTLSEHNKDFEALQTLEKDCNGSFSKDEVHELRRLLGLHGFEVEKRLGGPGAKNAEYISSRQMDWGRRREEVRRGSPEQIVIEQAYIRYGLILDEILSNQGGIAAT